MGEIGDDIVNGVVCEECCGFLKEPTGYPSKCGDCKPNKRKPRWRKKKNGGGKTPKFKHKRT